MFTFGLVYVVASCALFAALLSFKRYFHKNVIDVEIVALTAFLAFTPVVNIISGFMMCFFIMKAYTAKEKPAN